MHMFFNKLSFVQDLIDDWSKLVMFYDGPMDVKNKELGCF